MRILETFFMDAQASLVALSVCLYTLSDGFLCIKRGEGRERGSYEKIIKEFLNIFRMHFPSLAAKMLSSLFVALLHSPSDLAVFCML